MRVAAGCLQSHTYVLRAPNVCTSDHKECGTHGITAGALPHDIPYNVLAHRVLAAMVMKILKDAPPERPQ